MHPNLIEFNRRLAELAERKPLVKTLLTQFRKKLMDAGQQDVTDADCIDALPDSPVKRQIKTECGVLSWEKIPLFAEE